MTTHFLQLLSLIAAAAATAAEMPPPVQWQRSFGGTAGDNCDNILPTADGGFLLAGESASGISGNKTNAGYGGSDVWLVKINAIGEKLWDRSFGGSGDDGFDVSLTTNGTGGFMVFATSRSGISGNKTSLGYGAVDVWLINVDASGNKIWDKTFGGSADDGLGSIISTDDGGFLLGGISWSGVSGNKASANYGSADIWLIKVDANGNKVWEQSFGGNDREKTYDDDAQVQIVSAGDGGFLIGGRSMSGVSGNKTTVNYGNFDFWLIKVDANGTKLWDKSFGGNNEDVLYSLIAAPDGEFLLAGMTRSGISGNKTTPAFGLRDYWLIKVDASGNKVWEKTLGGSGEENLTSVALADDGGFLLGGWRGCYPNCGDFDFLVMKTDAQGNKVWEQSFSGDGLEFLNSVVATSDGGVLMAGRSNSGISGNKTVANFGDYDSWIIKEGICTNCPPLFTVQPTNQLVLPGTNVTLVAAAIGTSPLHFQWRFEETNILGATNANYSIANVSITNGHGNFSVVVSNDFGSLVSSNASIFVRIPPGIVMQPITQTVLQGANAIFTCLATGAPPIYYRWISNGFPVFTNTTGIGLFTNVQSSLTNGLRCNVFNAAASRNSATVSLIVLPDFDGDGMADSWEGQYGFNANDAADALLDFDGDGMINRDEYVAGTDPTDPDSVLRLLLLRSEGVILQFAAQSNVAYTVQFQTNVSAPWLTFSNVSSANMLRTVEVFDTPLAPAKLYRVVILANP